MEDSIIIDIELRCFLISIVLDFGGWEMKDPIIMDIKL